MYEIRLNNDRMALVDDADIDLDEYSWFVNSKGYAVIAGEAFNTRHERMHRVIVRRKEGRELARHELVDHVNGNTLDNRRSNLRLATNAENQWNRGLNSNNTTGYKGVYPNPGSRRKPWVARITITSKLIYLGSFKTAEEAARAYDCKALELHGQFARCNNGL